MIDFIDKGSILVAPGQWYDIHVSSDGGVFSYQINTTNPGGNYSCLASIDQDDVMGSHIGDCDSSMPDKIWIQLN